MMHSTVIKISFITVTIIFMSGISFSRDCYDYKHTTDSFAEKVIIVTELNSDFFKSYKASYPWYISLTKEGRFESALGRPLTSKDKIAVEHTSNCITTHQGEHVMDFCDATYKSGVLELEVHGGMPAYTGSLLITIKNSFYNCFFKAVYPVHNIHCLTWRIVSKQLKLKSAPVIRGKRLYAWISVVFDETSTEKGITSTKKYTIKGYLKPVVK